MNLPEVESLPPILIAHLFPKLEGMLVELLRSLAPQDWEKQTPAPKWKVKDVAAHLLDIWLRRLAASRSRETGESPKIISGAELVALINSLNAEGITKYRQLSTSELIARMEITSRECSEYLQSLDPFAPAMFPVSWAGEDESANWFDTARELTERWHHQQQIRDAVEKQGIMTREFYFPVLDCFMRALPHAYGTVTAKPGTLAQFNIAGDCGGSWFLLRDIETWRLVSSATGEKVSETTIPQALAWRIFTKGIAPDAAKSQVKVEGQREIGLHILRMVSIVG
jgi:uncharacterized protein (TIGR03083 family)